MIYVHFTGLVFVNALECKVYELRACTLEYLCLFMEPADLLM